MTLAADAPEITGKPKFLVPRSAWRGMRTYHVCPSCGGDAEVIGIDKSSPPNCPRCRRPDIDDIFAAIDRRLREVELIGASAEAMREKSGALAGVCPLELAPRECVAILHETLEVTEQGRGYYERVTGATGVLGPPAVLKILQSRFHSFCELNQYSAQAAGARLLSVEGASYEDALNRANHLMIANLLVFALMWSCLFEYAAAAVAYRRDRR